LLQLDELGHRPLPVHGALLPHTRDVLHLGPGGGGVGEAVDGQEADTTVRGHRPETHGERGRGDARRALGTRVERRADGAGGAPSWRSGVVAVPSNSWSAPLPTVRIPPSSGSTVSAAASSSTPVRRTDSSGGAPTYANAVASATDQPSSGSTPACSSRLNPGGSGTWTPVCGLPVVRS